MAEKTIEEKKAKFKEIAEKRMDKALKGISLLGNLSRKYDYEYSEEDVDAMIGALEKEIHAVKKRFDEEMGKQPKGVFSFGN